MPASSKLQPLPGNTQVKMKSHPPPPNYCSMDITPVGEGTDLIIMNAQAKNSSRSSLDDSTHTGNSDEHQSYQRNQNEVPENVAVGVIDPEEMQGKAQKNGSSGLSSPSVSPSPFSHWITSSHLFPGVYKLFAFILLPIWIWLTLFVLIGKDALPHGSIFVLILLACGGRVLGSLLEFIHLPPMIGMLGLGLALRNVPYIDYGKDLNLEWSGPIRQTALAVILTRAGLGLDTKVLLAFKGVILRFAFFPTVLEAVSVAVFAYFILDMPWVWGLLLGCVLAPVSPAVVVPRLLELKQVGYGMSKGIPTIIIASASLDNVIAISLFGVVLNFALAEGTLAFSILQSPLQVLLGLGYGLCWGFLLGMIFSSRQKADTYTMVVRLLFTFGGGVISVIGLSKLGFSGAGALGCLLSAFTAASIWRVRDVAKTPDPVSKVFLLLWLVFEPLLFGVIGCQIDILSLNADTILKGLACISLGILVRVLTVFLMVSKANLNTREKIFAAIAWIPKATVQAAIGPIALDMVRSHNKGPEAEKYGQTILALAVLTILLTAPIGELGVMFTGRRLLSKN